MKIARLTIPTVFVAFVLGGCASGNAVLQDADMTSLSKKFVPGQTTESQVKQILKGDPNSTCQDKDGNDIWIYSAQKENTSLIEYFKVEKDVHRKILRIAFDKNGTVSKVSRKTDNSTVSMIDNSGANQCQ